MVRKQISLFMKNAPGELGRLTDLFGKADVNIEALCIQDASAYVTELMQARGKMLKRIASTQSYESMRRDSDEFALIRLIVDDTDRAVEMLVANDYMFDIFPVMAVHLANRPGTLAKIASRFGDEGINIKYVYGSVTEEDDQVLFVFCPEDIDHAARVFPD